MILHGRSRITKRLAWIAALTLASLGTSLQAGDITGIVAFGDSLSDTGNTFLAAGTPPAPYYQGHYSNGPIWLEYLASREGVAPPTPSLKPGGTDYAWGGADRRRDLLHEHAEYRHPDRCLYRLRQHPNTTPLCFSRNPICMHAIERGNPWRVQGLRQIEHMQSPKHDHRLRAIRHFRETTCET